jgi:uncharacterized RDD family membrane protein YckC
MNKQSKIALKRFAAALVDYGVFVLFLFAYVMTLGERQEDGTYAVHGFRHIITIAIVWLIYFPFLESNLGYTLGKGLFGLKVIGPTGKMPTFSQSFRRHIVDFFDFMFFTTIAFISIGDSPEGVRRIGDRWANTNVVSDE